LPRHQRVLARGVVLDLRPLRVDRAVAGLRRHEPHPTYCLGPGDGPYDLLIGEFT
jgi:hypothetical protein